MGKRGEKIERVHTACEEVRKGAEAARNCFANPNKIIFKCKNLKQGMEVLNKYQPLINIKKTDQEIL